MVLLFVFVLFVVFAVVIPLWTYGDAQRNSPHSPFLWALVFFGGIIGILLYFIIGRDTSRPTATSY